MSADWLTFKSFFGDFGYTVYYLDSEGSEVPIESECEFQEAIRLAKLNKNRLKLVAYSDQSEAENTLFKNQCKYSDPAPTGVSLESLKQGTMKEEPVSKEKCQCQCQCNGDVPPEWFTQYMKKFKKELLHELESSLGFTVPIAVEKKLSDLKKEVIGLSRDKIEGTSDAVTGQRKKKQKGLEIDLVNYWEIKTAKKNDKLHSTKFERLEKVDNKTKVLLEERRRLLDKKRHLKQRFEKYTKTMEIEILKRSAAFHKKEVRLFLPPSSEFKVTLNFSNNGLLHWRDPWLNCYDFNGLYPKEHKIPLPRLQPMESGSTTLRGKVSSHRGTHYFKCRVFDSRKKISPEFICWAKVEINEPKVETPVVMINCKESHKRKGEDSVGLLIDFEKDEFAAAQKKIEENINEIEKRLQDINVFRPHTPSGKVGNSGADVNMPEESRSNGCDSLQNIGGKETNWKEKLEQEEVYFGVDCLHLDNSGSNLQKQENENGMIENSENIQKNGDSESSSDSELSVIFLSEEDENFVIIPVLSKNSSCVESMNEDKKNVRTPSVGTSNAQEVKVELAKQKSGDTAKTEIFNNSKEILNISERRQRQPGPVRSRRPSLGEISKSKPKKIKPSSTEYRFTTANLTQPTFIQITERFSEERPSKFTFTGDKNEEKSPLENFLGRETPIHTSTEDRAKVRPCREGIFVRKNSESGERVENKSTPAHKPADRHSKPIFTKREEDKSQKKDDFKDYTIPTTDGSRQIIYAVNSKGRCFPVGELLKDWDNWRVPKDTPNGSFTRRDSEHLQRSEKRYDRCNEVPVVNDLPTALVNGATSVASLAFNTAKSVINNLHSAFVTEGKAEMGKPAYGNRKKASMNALVTLVEMGFKDIELNQKLLQAFENDVMKVVEELIQKTEQGES